MSRILLVMGLVVLAGSAAAQTLIALDRFVPEARVLNPATGAQVGPTVPITMPGQTILLFHAAAQDPTTGIVYAAADLTVGSDRLVTINPATGVATLIGNLPIGVAGLQFDAAGQLFMVLGDGAPTNPRGFFSVNKATAASTFLFLASPAPAGPNDQGEAIGFNPSEPTLMYHFGGFQSQTFEKFNTTTGAKTNIGITGAPAGGINILAMGFDSATGGFFTVSAANTLGRISTTGVYTDIGPLPAGLSAKGVGVLPTISPSTLNLNLGTTASGTASTPVTFNLSGFNLLGDVNIATGTGVEASLSAAVNYTNSLNVLRTNATTGHLASTQIFVRIQSSATAGPIAGNLTLTSTAAATVLIAVTGTVNPPPAPEMNVVSVALPVADGGTHNVGGQIVGAQAVNYTIQNTGNAPLNLTGLSPFVVTGTPNNVTGLSISAIPSTPVAGAGSTNFTISYTISAVAGFSFTVSIANDDANENPYNWTVSGNGTAAPEPEMDVLRNAVPLADGGTDALGTITVGVQQMLTYTIQNNGTAPLTITTPVAAPGAQANCVASINTQPTSPVANPGSTTLVVFLTASGNGAFSCTISIANTDTSENPYNWTISGTGLVVAPEMDVTRAAAPVADGGTDTVAGTQTTAVAFTLTYTITNAGNGDLTITTPVTLGTPANCTVNATAQPVSPVTPANTTTLVLSVTPTAPGLFDFTVSIANNDANENPYNWTVSGTAANPPPEMEVARTATSVADGGNDAVGNLTTGAAANLTYTISNVGAGPLTITLPVTISGQTNCTATVTTQPNATVANAGSTTLVVSVTPTADGAFSFDISIGNDDANENPYDWTVSGTASTPPPPDDDDGGDDGSCTAGVGALPWFVALPALLALRRRWK